MGKLSDTTVRLRRNLLFISTIWFFINAFDVTALKFSMVEFRTSDAAPTVLSTVFAVLIGYHLIALVWHLYSDWERWRLDSYQSAASEAADRIRDVEHNQKLRSDGRQEYLSKIHHFEQIDQLRENQFMKMKTNELVRFCVLDAGLPLVAGVSALIWSIRLTF